MEPFKYQIPSKRQHLHIHTYMMYIQENEGQKNFLAAASCWVLKKEKENQQMLYIFNLGKKQGCLH